jgi:energy-coupling factor transport system ATP-binding protein
VTRIARAEHVTYRYPAATRDALSDVSLAVDEGELVVIAGASGCGKSTLLRAFCGLVPHFHGGRFAGRVTVAGLDTATSPVAAITRVAAIAFQDPEAQGVYRDVLRDVVFGLENHGVAAQALEARAYEALERVAAAHLAGRTLDGISSGELQRVALAGVLAPRPRLLVLDEPTAQLDDTAAAQLTRTLRSLADQGVAVIIAEHRLDRVVAIADRVVTLDGAAAVVEPHWPDRHETPTGRVVLAADGLVAERGARPVIDDWSLRLHAGEVVALRGDNGAGKTTLLRVLAGLDTPTRGRITLDGTDVTALAVERRYPRVVLVPQDPGRHLLCESVRDEIALGGGDAALLLAALDLEAFADRHPRDLSAGERERVAIAAGLAADPLVALLDEPTRGMDRPRRARLAALLRSRARAGGAVLVATHDAAFAAACADRTISLGWRDTTPRSVTTP